MQKWEYCGVEVNLGGQFFDPNDKTWHSLSELGDEGWEMVQVIPYHPLTVGAVKIGFAFFKRPAKQYGSSRAFVHPEAGVFLT